MDLRQRAWLPVLLAALGASPGARADVTLDGTLGPAGALPGPDYLIPAEVGVQAGGNLFHSFGRFGIDKGESATFSGPASVTQVIGRVTGGEVSRVDGLVRSTIPGAGLYLVNPAGVVLGPDARLDVDGSFHATSADVLRLEDGGRFDARNPANSRLTTAPVAAFGFLDQAPAPVSLEGGLLQVPPGEQISLTGGEVRIDNGTLHAPGGRIDLATASGGSEITRDASGVTGAPPPGAGPIAIVHTLADRHAADGVALSNLDAGGIPGGSVRIAGGRIVLDGASVTAGHFGPGDAGRVLIQAESDVALLGGAALGAPNLGDGKGADLEVRTGGTLLVDGDSVLGTVALGDGPAGAVQIRAADVQISNGGLIVGRTVGRGDAGTILIEADGLRLLDGGGITGSSAGPGRGGGLDLRIRGETLLRDGGSLLSLALGEGNAGGIRIESGELRLDGVSQISAATVDSGRAGDVTIDAERVRIEGASSVASTTTGAGDAGAVRIGAGRFELASDASVASPSLGPGRAGLIEIRADEWARLSGGAFVLVNAFAPHSAGAGSILIAAPAVEIADGASVTSSTSGAGAGGTIRLEAGTLVLRDGGDLAAGSLGEGGGGNVEIAASEGVLITGSSGLRTSGITASASGTGDAGSISIRAPQLDLTDGAVVSTTTHGPGNAGAVRIFVDRLAVADGGVLSSATLGSGAGGAIEVEAAESVTIARLAIVNNGSLVDEGGDAGAIRIRTPRLELAEQGYIDSTTAGKGRAGDVTLTLDRLVIRDGAALTSSTLGSGAAGAIRIQASESVIIVGPEDRSLRSGLAASALGEATGDAGLISIETPYLELAHAAEIDSITDSSGRGGDVRIQAADVLIRDGAQIVATTQGSGQGGSVEIVAPGSLRFERGAGTFPAAVFVGSFDQATGAAGSVRIQAGELVLTGNTGISTSTQGAGPGGDILIEVAREVRLQGSGDDEAQINAGTSGSGRGGRIEIRAPNLVLSENGFIASQSTGSGNAGDILIQADRLLQVDAGAITARSAATTGGNIEIDAASTQLTRGGQITASVFGDLTSDGGNVTVRGDNLAILEGGRITATASVGLGGHIIVDTRAFLHDAASLDQVLDASSGTAGNDGTVEVNAPELDISGSLVALRAEMLDVSALLSRRCGAAETGRRSSLLVRGREALPRSPEGDPGGSAAGCLGPGIPYSP